MKEQNNTLKKAITMRIEKCTKDNYKGIASLSDAEKESIVNELYQRCMVYPLKRGEKMPFLSFLNEIENRLSK